ncbi:hypothetical protein ACO0RG_002911 [Hanseniaspora osmophila]
MSIQPLSEKDQNLLRSSVLIPNFDAIVRGLIANSLDSNASHINLSLDIESFTTLLVYDNGIGILPECLPGIGVVNHATSKHHNFAATETQNTYGFKGCFLFSLSSCCTSLEVISKRKAYNSVWKFDTLEKKNTMISPNNLIFHESGTLLKVNNIYSKFPVRLKIMKSKPKHQIVQNLKQIIFDLMVTYKEFKKAIVINVEFINSNLSDLSYTFGFKQSSSTNIIANIFNEVFPNVLETSFLKKVSTTFKNFKIEGTLSTRGLPTTTYQYIFFNKFPFKHNQDIQEWFKKANMMFENMNNFDSSKFLTKSVGNPFRSFPVIILVIHSKTRVADILNHLDPETEYLSDHYDINIIVSILDKILESFIKHLSLTSGQECAPVKEHSKTKLQTKLYAEKASINMVLNSKVKRACLDFKEIEGTITKSFNNHASENKVNGTRRLSYNINKAILSSTGLPSLSKKLRLSIPSVTPPILDNIHELDLKKSDISNAFVINQIGEKFILVKLRSENNKLCIIDQHAADERIKLESFLFEFICRPIPLAQLSQSHQAQESQLLLLEHFSAHEVSLFEQFYSDFLRVGIQYTLLSENTLKIKSLPTILCQKIKTRVGGGEITYDLDFLRNGLLQHAYDLDNGNKRKFRKQKMENSKGQNWWLQTQSIPTVLLELFHSKACRSAIMFGQKLTLKDCETLVSNLSQCHMPFHCAHGRPSITPLTDFAKGSSNLTFRHEFFEKDYEL